MTAELQSLLRSRLGAFGLCLDLPLGLLMVWLGVVRPSTWTPFFLGIVVAFAAALCLTAFVQSLEPATANAPEESPYDDPVPGANS